MEREEGEGRKEREGRRGKEGEEREGEEGRGEEREERDGIRDAYVSTIAKEGKERKRREGKGREACTTHLHRERCDLLLIVLSLRLQLHELGVHVVEVAQAPVLGQSVISLQCVDLGPKPFDGLFALKLHLG